MGKLVTSAILSSSVGTLGRGDAGFPAEGAGGNIERQKFAARRPREQATATGDAARKAAHGQGRCRALVDPLA